jgi:chromosome segregation ATPase
LEALQRTVKHFEDHAAEWKTAHDQAAVMIGKAERMRGEHETLLARIRELEQKNNKKVSVDSQYALLREISEQVDAAEGEIASKEIALGLMKSTLAAKEKMLASEKKKVEDIEYEIDSVLQKRADLEQRRGECKPEEEEALAVNFSGVCV